MKKKSFSPLPLFPSSPIPKMLEGYYSGDRPNPNLRAFVDAHLKGWPYDPATDDYDAPAFDKPIESTKATAIYNMHTYWSKKPHDAIRQYIRHYTKPGDLVLDPFCGSGGTALAALMEGRKAIAIDRSPAATFITKNYCTRVDVEQLQAAFEELKLKVKPEMDWLYETRCDRCGGKATTAYTVYSQTFQCPRCSQKVPLFDCVEVEGRTAAGKPKKVNACPHCHKRGIVEEICTRDERFGVMPVMVSYLCESGCKPQRGQRRHNDPDRRKRDYFERLDLGKIREIEFRDIPHWYPRDRMMHAPEDRECWGVKWRAGTSNFRTVDELFTKRNLWALATFLDACQQSSAAPELLFVFQSNILSASIMQRYREAGGGFANGTYYVPQVFIEREQLGCFSRKLSDVISAQKEISESLTTTGALISTQSSTELSAIPSSSIDYVFTDPPYAEKVQYGELNFVWEAWLRFDTHWHDEEIIVNDVRGKTEADWTNMMGQAMRECYRVLKPGRWLSLCYHDTSEGTWALVQDIMAEAGFMVDRSGQALFIDTGQKSYNQTTADKVTMRDLLINFQKPKPGKLAVDAKIIGDEDESTFHEKVREIIREHLSDHPGVTKDRVYDEVVSRMVRAGRMEAHNFDQLLGQVAEPVREPLLKNLFEYQPQNFFGTHEIVRWYLKETEVDKVDAAESAKEDAAAKSVEGLIAKHIKERPWDEGVHYSDIFEHYIYSVRDKPRRLLQDWLLDYFYKTPAGTYRLPATDEEAEAKERGRAAGTNRRIKRYVAYLEQGSALPDKERPSDPTLVEWIRHCKRSGLFEQGRLLYERGGLNLDNLPEEAMVNVEEDYQVCARMLARAGGRKQAKQVKKGK